MLLPILEIFAERTLMRVVYWEVESVFLKKRRNFLLSPSGEKCRKERTIRDKCLSTLCRCISFFYFRCSYLSELDFQNRETERTAWKKRLTDNTFSLLFWKQLCVGRISSESLTKALSVVWLTAHSREIFFNRITGGKEQEYKQMWELGKIQFW